MDVEVRETPGKGKCIFAAEAFSKGESILTITGAVIETEHPEEYPEDIREHWGPLGKRGNVYRYIAPDRRRALKISWRAFKKL